MASPSPVPAAMTATLLPFGLGAPALPSSLRLAGRTSTAPSASATRSLSSVTRLMPSLRDIAFASMTHGRFVATHRPCTTGPATPNTAAVTRTRGGLLPRNSFTTASSEGCEGLSYTW